MGFDRDAAFAFEIHAVEQLLLEVADGDGSGYFLSSRSASVDLP